MKKIVSFLLVTVLVLAMAPACFAYDGHDCQYLFFEYNGDGTHTGYCCYSLWHNFVDDCWSDNNHNCKCDFCAGPLHDWAEEWSFDEEAHWYTCLNCGEDGELAVEDMKDYAEHEFGEDGACTVCGYLPEDVAEESAE